MAERSRPRLALRIEQEALPLAAPFSITGYMFTETPVIVVRLQEDGRRGEGEAAGVYYLGDDVAGMTAAIEKVREPIEAGVDRRALRTLLPSGGARNALDCALWDLEAKRSGRPVWQLAGLEAPRALTTTFTVGADAPEAMAGRARAFAQAKALKLKLTGDADLDGERIRAVRRARPDVWLGVDANQGFVPDSLEALMATLLSNRVQLIEQPFPRGREADLDTFATPIAIAADESAQGLADIEGLIGRFDVINIKLDKCGGLTEGLAMAAEARDRGLGVMVGNMLGSSLAMAPAIVLGQLCDIVDLDGPMLLASDRTPSVVYEDGCVSYPACGWGNPG